MSTETKYKVIDERLFPSVYANGDLCMVFTKILKEEGSTAAASFGTSITASQSKVACLMHRLGEPVCEPEITGAIGMLVGDLSDVSVTSAIEVATEGLKGAAKEKVEKALLSTRGVVNKDDEVLTYKWSDEDKKTLLDAANKIKDDIDKMKSGTSSNANEGKLGHYAFKKHLLIQGEKGGLGFQATIAA